MKVIVDRAIPFLQGVLEPFAEVVYIDGKSFTKEEVESADALIIRTRTKCNAALLDGMIDRFEQELGKKTTVVATGGIAKFIVPLCKTPVIYDKDLLIKGLAALYRDNKRK